MDARRDVKRGEIRLGAYGNLKSLYESSAFNMAILNKSFRQVHVTQLLNKFIPQEIPFKYVCRTLKYTLNGITRLNFYCQKLLSIVEFNSSYIIYE